MNEKVAKFDAEQVNREMQIERVVDRELPSEREVQLLAREVFVRLVTQSGDPANRREVDEAWEKTLVIVNAYLAGYSRVASDYKLHRQRKIRAKLYLT